MITLLMIALGSAGFVIAFAFGTAGMFLFGVAKDGREFLASLACLFCCVFTIGCTIAALEWLS